MIAVILMAFFTLAAGVIINRTVFERLPHLEDEFAYLYQAKIFAGGHTYVTRDADQSAALFWQPFVIQPDTATDGVLKRFGKYTPGWPLVLTLGVLLGTPWLVNPVLAMLSVALVYRLGREIFEESVGVVSAALLAICPMALLLDATLMSHVPAMFMAVVFVYTYWRVTRSGRGRYRWAVLCGLALGLLLSTRPLSGLAIAVPVMLHALAGLMDSMEGKRATQRFVARLKPLLILSLFVLPTGLLWPVFNQIWTADWKTNTYTLLWSYDTPGFGEGHGLMVGGHTVEFGFRNARTDMEVYFRDLFGFTMSPTIEDYLARNLGWGAGIGLSWLLVLAGLIAGRKNQWIWLFFELFLAIVIAQMTYWIGSVVYGTAAYSLRYWYEATFAVCLVAGYGVVALARSVRGTGTWLLWLVGAVVLYAVAVRFGWEVDILIGGILLILYGLYLRARQARKSSVSGQGTAISYLNGLENAKQVPPASAQILSGRLRLAWKSLWPGYVLFEVALLASLLGYSPARFQEPAAGWPNGLFRYNEVGQQQLDQINAVRQQYGAPGQKVLIIVLRSPDRNVGDNWRDYGAAMYLTSPYLDSDVIVARVFDSEDAPKLIQRFPGRLVLYQIGQSLAPTIDAAVAGDPPPVPPQVKE